MATHAPGGPFTGGPIGLKINIKPVSTFIETQAHPASGNPPWVDKVPKAGWL